MVEIVSESKWTHFPDAWEHFKDTGGLDGLLVYADWLFENDGLSHRELEGMIRWLATLNNRELEAIHFHFVHGACSHRPAVEIRETGWLRGAVDLAESERWVQEMGWEFEWVQDLEYSPDDYDAPDMPGIAWVCLLRDGSRHEGEHAVVESVGAVTFGGDGYPDGDPYKRVIQAQLASEAAPNQAYFREPDGDYLYITPDAADRGAKSWLYDGRASCLAGVVSSVVTTSVSTEHLATCERVQFYDVPIEWHRAFGVFY